MKAEILKVVFNIKYDYNTQSREYVSKISVLIPCEDSEDLDIKIHKAFRNQEKELLDEDLWYGWGKPKSEYDENDSYIKIGRYKDIEISDISLEKLEEKVSIFLEETKKLLTEIVEENIQKVENIPAEHIEELVLFFPKI